MTPEPLDKLYWREKMKAAQAAVRAVAVLQAALDKANCGSDAEEEAYKAILSFCVPQRDEAWDKCMDALWAERPEVDL